MVSYRFIFFLSWEEGSIPDLDVIIECERCKITIDEDIYVSSIKTRGNVTLMLATELESTSSIEISENSILECLTSDELSSISNYGIVKNCNIDQFVNYGESERCNLKVLKNFNKVKNTTVEDIIYNYGIIEVYDKFSRLKEIKNENILKIYTNCISESNVSIQKIINKGTLEFVCINQNIVPIIQVQIVETNEESLINNALYLETGTSINHLLGSIYKLIINNSIENANMKVNYLEIKENGSLNLSNITVINRANIKGLLKNCLLIGLNAMFSFENHESFNNYLCLNSNSYCNYEGKNIFKTIEINQSIGAFNISESETLSIVLNQSNITMKASEISMLNSTNSNINLIGKMKISIIQSSESTISGEEDSLLETEKLTTSSSIYEIPLKVNDYLFGSGNFSRINIQNNVNFNNSEAFIWKMEIESFGTEIKVNAISSKLYVNKIEFGKTGLEIIIIQGDSESMIKINDLFSVNSITKFIGFLNIDIESNGDIKQDKMLEITENCMFNGKKGIINLENRSSLILKNNQSMFEESFNLSGTGIVKLYSVLIIHGNNCLFNTPISLYDNAELQLSSCENTILEKEFFVYNGTLLSKTNTTLINNGSFKIQKDGIPKIKGINFINLGTFELTNAKVLFDSLEFFQNNIMNIYGESKIESIKNSSVKNSGIINIENNFNTDSSFPDFINFNQGILDVKGIAKFNKKGINQGIIKSNSIVTLSSWDTTETSVLKSSENSQGSFILESKTNLFGKTENCNINIPKFAEATFSPDLSYNNTKVILDGGTIKGFIRIDNQSQIELNHGYLDTLEIDMTDKSTLYLKSSNEVLSLSSSMIHSRGTINIFSSNINSTNSVIQNEGNILFDSLFDQEGFPIPIDNNGTINFVNSHIKLLGLNERSILLDSTSVIYFDKSFEFGKDSYINGGTVTCNNEIVFQGVVDKDSNFIGIESCSIHGYTLSFISNFIVASNSSINIYQNLECATMHTNNNTCIRFYSDLLTINNYLWTGDNTTLLSQSNESKIVVNSEATFSIGKNAYITVLLYLKGIGTFSDYNNYISSLLVSNRIYFVSESSETNSDYLLMTICNSGLVSSIGSKNLKVHSVLMEYGSTFNFDILKVHHLFFNDKILLCPDTFSTSKSNLIGNMGSIYHLQSEKMLYETQGAFYIEKINNNVVCNDFCLISNASSELNNYFNNYGTSLFIDYFDNNIVINNEYFSNNKQNWLNLSDQVLFNNFSHDLIKYQDRINEIKNLQSSAENFISPSITNSSLSVYDHFELFLPLLYFVNSKIKRLNFYQGTGLIDNLQSKDVILNNYSSKQVFTRELTLDSFLSEKEPLLFIEDLETNNYIQFGGITIINHTLLCNNVTISSGLLHGNGTIYGSLELNSFGVIFPRFFTKKLTITDKVSFKENSIFISNIINRNSYDSLETDVLFIAGGSVIVSFEQNNLTNYEPFPIIGDEFILILYNTFNGSNFTEHKIIGLETNISYEWIYTTNDFRLRFIGCAAGMIPSMNHTNCVSCPINFWSNKGDLSCYACPEGYERTTNQNKCTKIDPNSKDSTSQDFIAFFFFIGFGLFLLLHSSKRRRKLIKTYPIIQNRIRSLSQSIQVKDLILNKTRRNSVCFDKLPLLIHLKDFFNITKPKISDEDKSKVFIRSLNETNVKNDDIELENFENKNDEEIEENKQILIEALEDSGNDTDFFSGEESEQEEEIIDDEQESQKLEQELVSTSEGDEQEPIIKKDDGLESELEKTNELSQEREKEIQLNAAKDNSENLDDSNPFNEFHFELLKTTNFENIPSKESLMDFNKSLDDNNNIIKNLLSPINKGQVSEKLLDDINKSSEKLKGILEDMEQLRLKQVKNIEEMNFRLRNEEASRNSALKKANFTPTKYENKDNGWATARVQKIEMSNVQPRYIEIDNLANPNLYFKDNKNDTVKRRLTFSSESD